MNNCVKLETIFLRPGIHFGVTGIILQWSEVYNKNKNLKYKEKANYKSNFGDSRAGWGNTDNKLLISAKTHFFKPMFQKLNEICNLDFKNWMRKNFDIPLICLVITFLKRVLNKHRNNFRMKNLWIHKTSNIVFRHFKQESKTTYKTIQFLQNIKTVPASSTLLVELSLKDDHYPNHNWPYPLPTALSLVVSQNYQERILPSITDFSGTSE